MLKLQNVGHLYIPDMVYLKPPPRQMMGSLFATELYYGISATNATRWADFLLFYGVLEPLFSWTKRSGKKLGVKVTLFIGGYNGHV